MMELPIHAVHDQVALSGWRPVRMQHAHLPGQRVLRRFQGGEQCICGPVCPHPLVLHISLVLSLYSPRCHDQDNSVTLRV